MTSKDLLQYGLGIAALATTITLHAFEVPMLPGASEVLSVLAGWLILRRPTDVRVED